MKQRSVFIIFLALMFFFVGAVVARYYFTKTAINLHQENTEEESPALTEPSIKASNPQISPEAKVKIVIFSSYTCPHCSSMMAILGELLDKYPGKIGIVWKDFIVSDDSRALRSAVAARCAQTQNKFWEFNGRLLANQTQLSDPYLFAAAKDLELDQDKFGKCLDNEETLPLVQVDFQEGLDLNIDGTPYFFIGQNRFSGLVSLEDLENNLKPLLP